MNSKTPVTLLHEFVMKRNCVPDYELIHNGVGTHDPLFVWRVSALGQSASGRGKSKKEAKHSAALELLRLLDSSIICQKEEAEMSVPKLSEATQSPYADVLKDNAVGSLQDFCCTHRIPPPVYEQTRDEGLPHAKLFGMRCRVSNLWTEAEARTKKQAKQNASHLMLQRLKDLLEDGDIEQHTVNTDRNSVSGDNQAVVNAVTKVLEEQETSNLEIPWGTLLAEFDSIFKSDFLAPSEILASFKDKDPSYFDTVPDPLSVFSNLMVQLEFKWDSHQVNTDRQDVGMYALQIKGLNKATFIGRGSDETAALEAAAISALKWFAVMIS